MKQISWQLDQKSEYPFIEYRYAAQLTFESGLIEEADAMIVKSKTLFDETGEFWGLSVLYQPQARISIHNSDPTTAETQLLSALDVACQQQAVLWELYASIDLAKLRQGQNKVEEAIALLEPVHDSIDDGDCLEDQVSAREPMY